VGRGGEGVVWWGGEWVEGVRGSRGWGGLGGDLGGDLGVD
jgi:hypothetical protein